jgi:hypothetical protein
MLFKIIFWLLIKNKTQHNHIEVMLKRRTGINENMYTEGKYVVLEKVTNKSGKNTSIVISRMNLIKHLDIMKRGLVVC